MSPVKPTIHLPSVLWKAFWSDSRRLTCIAGSWVSDSEFAGSKRTVVKAIFQHKYLSALNYANEIFCYILTEFVCAAGNLPPQ